MAKFSFKKQPPATGLMGVGAPYPSTDIKYGGKVVGTIVAPTWKSKGRGWRVQLAVKQDAHPGWGWRFLSREFDSEPEARTYLQENAVNLVALGLYQFEG